METESMKQIAAEVLAQSIIGRVEAILTDALAAKVAHQQRVGVEAQRDAEKAVQEKSRAEELTARAQAHLVEAKEQLKELEPLRVEVAALQAKRDDLRDDISGLEKKLASIVEGYKR